MTLGTLTETDSELVSRLLAPQTMAKVESFLLDTRTMTVRYKEPFWYNSAERTNPESSQNRFQRLGKGWLIVFQGRERVFPHLVGFTYIHQLLQHPSAPIAASQLMGAASVPRIDKHQAEEAVSLGLQPEGDLGDLIDKESLGRARGRLVELEEAEEEARLFGDSNGLEKIQDERDGLLGYITKAHRLDGKLRLTGSRSGKNRQAVWQAIHRAYEEIADEHPDLLRFLEASITTAGSCRYDPVKPTDWRL